MPLDLCKLGMVLVSVSVPALDDNGASRYFSKKSRSIAMALASMSSEKSWSARLVSTSTLNVSASVNISSADAAPLFRHAAYFLSLLVDHEREGTKYRAAHFRDYLAGCIHQVETASEE